MRRPSIHLLLSFKLQRLIIVLVAGYCVPWVTLAQNADQELLDQLYREIVTSSTGKPVSADGTADKPAKGNAAIKEDRTVAKVPTVTDPTTEHLQHEIDKMMDDIRVRHTEAVRFMQDTQ